MDAGKGFDNGWLKGTTTKGSVMLIEGNLP